VPKHEHLETVANAVAEQLRRERLRRKLSMNAVAERGGLSQQMVSYVERGLRNPTLDTLLRMSSALDVDLAKIIATAQRQARTVR
jgi:transcriptional regulator with XRE-family HTH domain